MTLPDEGVSGLLKRGVPLPPATFDSVSLSARVMHGDRPQRSIRRSVHNSWSPSVSVVAASVVVLLIAGGVALLASDSGSSHHKSSPAASATATSRHKTSSPAVSKGQSWSFGAWNLAARLKAKLLPATLLASDDMMYAELSDGGEKQLVQIAGDGTRVIKRVRIPEESSAPVLVGGNVAVLSTNSSAKQVSFYNAKSFNRSAVASASDAVQSAAGSVSLAGNSRTSALYYAAASGIRTVAPGGSSARFRSNLQGKVTDIALSADGAKLFAMVGDGQSVLLEVFDTTSGSRLNSFPIAVGSSKTEMTVAKDAVWVASVGSMSQTLTFGLLKAHAAFKTVANGTGNQPANVAVIGNKAWIGGPDVVACANANSGVASNRQPLHPGSDFTGYLSGIVAVRHNLFGVYQNLDNNFSGLVRVTPAKECGGA